MACVKGHVSAVSWPGGPATILAISEALAKRPDESTRNWIPSGSPLALLGVGPVDQSPAELDDETAEHLDAEAAQAAKQIQLMGLLAELGLEVKPDGTISGVIDLAAVSDALTADVLSEDTP
jgi:hypothetical protein